MTNLNNKTVFITAAAQGFGRASALVLAAAGARVIATDINSEKLSELASNPSITTRRLNVLSGIPGWVVQSQRARHSTDGLSIERRRVRRSGFLASI